MDGDRKYKQRGYQDDNVEHRGRDDRQRPNSGPRPPLDVTGPRLPRMVQTITAARCWQCATMLGTSVDFAAGCPKCSAALHCCKQCAHFEPSTRFQCLKPIPERLPYKDQANQCTLFSPRVTVAREANGSAATSGSGPNGGGGQTTAASSPRTPADARAAFDNLFKK